MSENNGEINKFKALREQRRKKQKKSLALAALSAVLLCIFALCGFAAMFRPHVEETPPFIGTDGDTAADGAGAEEYKRKDGFYTFLVCGIDKISNNTDVMMLVSLDTKGKAVNILQIPRDTFINREKADFRVTRVNSIYTAAHNVAAQNGLSGAARRKAAMEKLCTSLERSLCVTIDRYVLMDTAAFVGIIDAVGGIEYDVPFDMDYEDPEQDLYIHLKAGLQTLDGKKAEQFIRYRSGYATGDVGRVEARGDFLRAVYTQILTKISLGSAIDIAGTLISSVTTDAGGDDIAFFATALYGIGTGNINIKTITGSPVQNPKTGVWTYYAINKTAALADINAFANAFGADVTYELFDKNAVFTDDPNGENPYISQYYYSNLQSE
ncbi:MAG: LCP family protein [Clostridia bacterium]|nr:LCP family protein [Clostridia bacterium]